MRKRGQRFGFTLEAISELVVSREFVRKNFDSDPTVEPPILGGTHFSHPTGTDGLDDDV